MSLRKLNVLIVDDNASDRLIVKAMLDKMGFRNVQEAEDGKIAEKKLFTAVEILKPFDLILVDWQMPRENGIGLLRLIRSQSKLRAAKVVMITGLGDEKLVREAKEAGIDDFMVKPLEVSQFEAKLRKLLKVNA